MTAGLQVPASLSRRDYGSRFINNDDGRPLWESLQDEDRTAHDAAWILATDGSIWDRSTDVEINALLFEHDIDPAQIAHLRADVIAVAKRARVLADRNEKLRAERRG